MEDHGIHIIFIDYVQLLNTREGFSDNRYLNLNYITRRLKELAKELDVPIVILLLCEIKRSYRGLIKNVSDSFVSLDELESANSDGVNSELPPLSPSFSNGPLSFK